VHVCVTLQVPFGDTFHQELQWACQHEGPGRCSLRITGQVKFTKACFVKGIIQKASEEVCPFVMLFMNVAGRVFLASSDAFAAVPALLSAWQCNLNTVVVYCHSTVLSCMNLLYNNDVVTAALFCSAVAYLRVTPHAHK